VIPEGGDYLPGVPANMYVVTSYADGRPAKTRVKISGMGKELSTDSSGVLSVPIGSPLFQVRVRDDSGRTAKKEVNLKAFGRGGGEEEFLLRTDSASYEAGDPIEVTALSATDGIVYVDVVKTGQTLLTKTVEIRKGKGKLIITPPPELTGTVRISGYRIYNDRIVQDSRTIVIRQGRELHVRAKPLKPVFKPGEEIGVDIEVTDGDGIWIVCVG